MAEISAKRIYQRQNQTLHKAFAAIGMPYKEEKAGWISLIRSLIGRKNIGGLTDLTLGERRTVIAHLGRQGVKLKNPFVPRDLAGWSGGDPERTASIRGGATRYPGRPQNMDDPVKGRLLGKIEALLAEAGREWDYAHTMAQRMSKKHVRFIQWCSPRDLHNIVAALMIDAKRHGRYTGE